MTPQPPTPAHNPVVARARQFLDEGREADAAAWLERHPSPHADRLHREIAVRAATTALQSGEIAVATAWLDRGLVRGPADPLLNFFRGNLYQDSGHIAEAIACFRRCVAAQPRREEFVCNLGQALVRAGAHDEAVAVLRALPDSAAARLNLGTAHEALGDLRAAALAYEEAVRLEPAQVAGWLNLGAVRERLEELPAAYAACNRAVALNPSSARAHLERGRIQAKLKQFSEAIVSFERSLALDPADLDARFALASARQYLCDWCDLPSLRSRTILPLLHRPGSRNTPAPFTLQMFPDAVTPAELRRVAEQRSARLAQGAVPLRAGARIPTDRPLRLGYLSPDFGNHAVGTCIRSLFARHDRTRVSVHAFSIFKHPDNEFRSAMRAGCDSWDDLDRCTDRTAAEQIAAREIDLLVDLAGHTKGDRIGILAWRPAPVQVAWLGYPGTTGAAYVDHLLADRHVILPEEEATFSERIVRLPGCYLPTDDSYPIAPGGDDRAANGLPATGFVFCAFNNPYKIEPLIFGAWMEILRRVPDSCLWLRGEDAATTANLRREAHARGIDPARLVFDLRRLPRAEHLARHRAAGLFLDTHFYNAHSTASDALRAGLPVLTFPGQAFPSRVGLSLVSTLDLATELVASSPEDYVARAVRLATEPDRLRAVRAHLDQAISTPGGLFDTTAFARKLEDAFARLCGRHP
ncbi:MAG TPA: tetratricopeptide repeat protein [Opitutaceae bacterium]|nr:tetratricopeptide repeat protein [Opitutaceae bacterium]